MSVAALMSGAVWNTCYSNMYIDHARRVDDLFIWGLFQEGEAVPFQPDFFPQSPISLFGVRQLRVLVL